MSSGYQYPSPAQTPILRVKVANGCPRTSRKRLWNFSVVACRLHVVVVILQGIDEFQNLLGGLRRSVSYDALMQMGRWFGFRGGYEDLTRIYTTAELSGWFTDLAFVEHRLREDLRVYEEQELTPDQVGMRIWQHPTMQVTSPLKRRFVSSFVISQSYSFSLEQTFKFPLRRLDDLAVLAEENLQSVRAFLPTLGATDWSDKKGPVWKDVPAARVLEFLREFRCDTESRSISLPLICAYIGRQVELGELGHWTIAVRGRESCLKTLGEADWGVSGGHIWQIQRTRIKDTDSLGVITSPGDEAVGLEPRAAEKMHEYREARESENLAARRARPPENGLLLLYPISRFSGHDSDDKRKGNRRPLFEDPNDPSARDIVGLAISLPMSNHPQVAVDAYLEGTAGWRPVE